jgi:hypothetical protein
MTRTVGYIRRRGYTYIGIRDSRGRFVSFTRSRARAPTLEAPSGVGEKHICLYGTADTSEGMYRARVDAHGKGKDLYYLIKTLKEGYVPRRRYAHVHGRADMIEDNFFEYFTRGEWTDAEVES